MTRITKTRTKGTNRSARPVGQVSLERALSKLGILSRSQGRAAILAGEVKVDGRVVRDPTLWVVPEEIQIAVQGKQKAASKMRLFLFHKPKATVCSRADEKSRKTIFDYFPALEGHYHSVGRLDFVTTGLLLVTNNPRFSDHLTDPRQAIPRVYHATVKGEVGPQAVALLTAGVRDGDEELRAQGATLRKTSGRESHLLLTLTEGKNREVRRLCEAVGHEVTALKRVSFGPFELGDLAPGKFIEISPEEALSYFPSISWR